MSDYKTHLEEQLKDPEFSAEWERQRPEREYIKAIVGADSISALFDLLTETNNYGITVSDKSPII